MGSLSGEIVDLSLQIHNIERAVQKLRSDIDEIVVRIGRSSIEVNGVGVRLDEETVKRIKELIIDILTQKRREHIEKLKQLVQGLE